MKRYTNFKKGGCKFKRYFEELTHQNGINYANKILYSLKDLKEFLKGRKGLKIANLKRIQKDKD